MDLSNINIENVNKRDEKGNSPIFYADAKETIKLIEFGADIHQQNSKEKTALFGASYEKTKVLIDAGINVNDQDESCASALFFSDAATTRLLLDNGAEIELSDMEGDTALSVAASFNHVEKCKILIEAGAYIHGINLSTFKTTEMMSDEVKEFALNHEKNIAIELKNELNEETKHLSEELPQRIAIPKIPKF